MPRRLDHLVICVHDLAQAALDWQAFGFTLRPTGVLGDRGDRITVLGPSEMARRLPGVATEASPRFCAARLAVTDLDATRQVLESNGVAFEVVDNALLTAPAASHGLALEFVEPEAIRHD